MDRVTELCEAIWKGNAKAVARLLSRIDPNREDRWGRSPLSMAARYGDARLVRQLLDGGADVDGGRSQLTPLAYAAARREHEIVELLRGAGAAVSVVASVYLGDRRAVAKTDFVQVLLDRGADPNAADKRGSTPLHRASSSTGAGGTAGIDAAPFIELLLARGGDPKQKDRLGRPALRTRRAKP